MEITWCLLVQGTVMVGQIKQNNIHLPLVCIKYLILFLNWLDKERRKWGTGVRFELFTTLLRIHVFWDVTCLWLSGS